jgi:hypothetical protein
MRKGRAYVGARKEEEMREGRRSKEEKKGREEEAREEGDLTLV